METRVILYLMIYVLFFFTVGGTASGFYTVEDPVSLQICLLGKGHSGLMYSGLRVSMITSPFFVVLLDLPNQAV